ncbi:MAG: XdhC family protein [Pseudonocardia sp.]
MHRGDLLARVDALRAARTPFVLATVVRAERPTSAKPGDGALVLADGTVEGFVGGVCAESTVRLEGLRLLHAGESGLLRITPTADPGSVDAPHDDTADPAGRRTVNNPCLSGGTLEIFLEAVVPPALVLVFGEAPVARALVQVGRALDWDVRATVDAGAPVARDTTAVVVASHGRDEAAVLGAALKAEVPYVALVASPRRATSVLAELPAALRALVHAPAGLDIGARTPPEIALSVFADIVGRRPRVRIPDGPRAEAAEPQGPGGARDPICGMDVAVSGASLSAVHDGATRYFCGPGCRQAFLDDPSRFR